MANGISVFLTNVNWNGWQLLILLVIGYSTIVGVGSLLISKCLLRQAAARSWLLLLAISACVLLPLGNLVAQKAGWGFSIPVPGGRLVSKKPLPDPSTPARMDDATLAITQPLRTLPEARSVSSMITQANPLTQEPFAITTVEPPVEESQSLAQTGDRVVVLLGMIWLVCSTLLSIKLISSMFALQRTVRDAELCEDQRKLEILARVAHENRLANPPRLMISDRLAAPMVLAYLHPVVLIPEDSDRDFDAKQFGTMIAHELAHIRRLDGWTRLWVQMVCVLLPVQPLIWRLRKAYFEACEEACDDWAIANGHDPLELASALTFWSERSRNQGILTLAVGMSATRSRVVRLLKMQGAPSAVLSLRWQLGLATAATLFCTGLGLAKLENPSETRPELPAGQSSPIPAIPQEANHLAVESEQSQRINLVGICVDENDQPLADIDVRLFLVGLPNSAEAGQVEKQVEIEKTQSDREGRFAFEVNDAEVKRGAYTIVGQATDRATATAWIPFDGTKEQLQKLQLQLLPAATLKGRVVNEDGDPVSGAIVSVQNPMAEPVIGIRTAMTNEDGHYEITDLAAFDPTNEPNTTQLTENSFVVRQVVGVVRHPNYARDQFSYTSIPGNADITIKRPAEIEGQILLKGTNQPAVGAHIELVGGTFSILSNKATTDTNGKFRIGNLLPGSYRFSAKLEGKAILFLENLDLPEGSHQQTFQLENGGLIKGKVIDVTTELPIRLAEDESMSMSEALPNGHWYMGMPSAKIQLDGTFTMRLATGTRYFGMYFGPNWQGVNTDQLFDKGIEVREGEVVELEIRVKPKDRNPPAELKPLTGEAASALAEEAATAAINKLGGWVETESFNGISHVVEVNMVYHEDERMGREDNRLITDECFTYINKFPKLRRLVLYHEQVTDVGLASLRGMNNLEEVYFFDASKVTDQGVAALIELPNLKRVIIESGRLTDEALIYLGGLNSLEAVYLGDASEVTDRGVAALAKLPNLKRVGIDDGQLSDESLMHLSGIPEIQDISLSGANFTDTGLKHLKNCHSLKTLYLGPGKLGITNEGLRYLSGLTNLENLSLQDSQITDDGLEHLHSLSNLKGLSLAPTVSRKAFSDLRKILTKLDN